MKNEKKQLLMIAIGFVCLICSSCQLMQYQPFARDVKKKPQHSGIIALKPEHRDEDRQKAQKMMESNCGPLKPKILEENEQVIGQETKSSAVTEHDQGSQGKSAGRLFGIPVTSGARNASDEMASTATTVALKEWQISYVCEKPLVAKQ